MKPAISIVTPCLNRADMIGAAIESVLAQRYERFEHIIADGGSTDGTLEICRRYPHLRVISAPDKGIYDGLNKGLALVQGDIVGHLNSDDVYEPGVFSAVAEAFAADARLDAVCGGAAIYEGSRLIRDCSGPRYRELTIANALLGVPVINARFFTRAFYQRVGHYSLAYRLAADRDFLVRAVLAGCRWVSLDMTVYRYFLHPGSATCTHDFKAQRKFNLENAALAEDWLARGDVPGEVRRLSRRLYGNAVAHLAWLSLRQGHCAEALSHLLLRHGAPSLRPLAAAVSSAAVHAMARR
jgi:glycosyltransferase involved in cell wall biosynthesis